MIEQKDIDKMVNCRKAIDDSRRANQERVDKIAATPVPSQTLAKAQLESDRTKATEKCLAIIQENGFKSVSEFADWYNKIILEVYKAYRPMTQKCDWCGMKDLEDQMCVKTFGYEMALACCANPKAPPIDNAYLYALQREQKGTPGTFCPEGHGYQPDIKNYKELPNGVSFRWLP